MTIFILAGDNFSKNLDCEDYGLGILPPKNNRQETFACN